MATSTAASIEVTKAEDSLCAVCAIIWIFLKKFAPIIIGVLVTGVIFLLAGTFIFCWHKRRRRYFPEPQHKPPAENQYETPDPVSDETKDVPFVISRLSLPTPEVERRQKIISKSDDNRVSSMYAELDELQDRTQESSTDPDYIHAISYPKYPTERQFSGYDNNIEIESGTEDTDPIPLDSKDGNENPSKIIQNESANETPGEPDYAVPEVQGTPSKVDVENDLDLPTMSVWDTTGNDSVFEDSAEDMPPPPVIARMSVLGMNQEEIVWPRPPSYLFQTND